MTHQIENLDKVINNVKKNPKEFKILTPKKMLQRLTKALAQVKAGNTSENLQNEICQIMYQANEIPKKCITI